MREAVRVLHFHRLPALAHAFFEGVERWGNLRIERRAVFLAHLFPPFGRVFGVLHHRGRERFSLFPRLRRAVVGEVRLENAFLQILLLTDDAFVPLVDFLERRLSALLHARHALVFRLERDRVEEFRRALRLRELLSRNGDRAFLVNRLLELFVRHAGRLRHGLEVFAAALLFHRRLRIDVGRLESRARELGAQHLRLHLRCGLLQLAVVERVLDFFKHRRSEHRALGARSIPCLEGRLMTDGRRTAKSARHRAARAREHTKAQSGRQRLRARLQSAHGHVLERIYTNGAIARVLRNLVVHHIIRHRLQTFLRRLRARDLQHIHPAITREHLHGFHGARTPHRRRDDVIDDFRRVRTAEQGTLRKAEVRDFDARVRKAGHRRIVARRLLVEQQASVLSREPAIFVVVFARHGTAHAFEHPDARAHLPCRHDRVLCRREALEIREEQPSEACEADRAARGRARRRANARSNRARTRACPHRREHHRCGLLSCRTHRLEHHRGRLCHAARDRRHGFVKERRQRLLPLLLLQFLADFHRALALVICRRAVHDLVLQIVELELQVSVFEHRLKALDNPVRRAHLCHMMQRERRVLRVHVRHVPELRVRLPHRIHRELLPERILHLLRVVIHAERFLVRRLVLEERVRRNPRHRLDLPRPLQLLLVRLEIFEERLRTAETLRRPAARLRRIIHLIADDMACLARKSPCKIRRRVHHDRAVLLRVRERLVLCRVVPRLLCLCEIFLRERRRDRLLRVEYAIICLRQA